MSKLKSFKYFVNESLNNQTLINIDIQEDYIKSIKNSFNIYEWANYINNYKEEIVFLYNGPELGFPDEHHYKIWLIDLGIDENVIHNAIFFDKGYAFFRFCIDNHIDDNEIIFILRYMLKIGINDSRDIKDSDWKNIKKYAIKKNINIDSILELLVDENGDMLNVPELIDFLKDYSNVTICGGGINECLKEVEIALKVLNIKYKTLHKFTY